MFFRAANQYFTQYTDFQQDGPTVSTLGSICAHSHSWVAAIYLNSVRLSQLLKKLNQESRIHHCIRSVFGLFCHLLEYFPFWLHIIFDKRVSMLSFREQKAFWPSRVPVLCIPTKERETRVAQMNCKLYRTLKNSESQRWFSPRQMCCRIPGFNSAYLLRAWKPPARCLKVSWGAVLNE